MSCDIPEFVPQDGPFQVRGSTVFTGPCPWELGDRSFMASHIGRHLKINGRIWRVKGFETFATVQGPHLGGPVGIAVEPTDV